MYYAADAAFWNYFGSNGMAAIDAAFSMFNNLNPVSSYSSDLSEFPNSSLRSNWRAEALSMFDLKSATMQLIIEQLGLAEPRRYTWGLHDRALTPGTACPFGENYLVIKRNFDPAFGTLPSQLKPTSYVNGVLYSYEIVEFCTGPNPLAFAAFFPVDPVSDDNTAVAEYFGVGNAFTFFSTSPYGAFFTGLTRDDVGGLRYLYRTNNVALESAGPDALAHITNNTPQVLLTSNLTLFAAQSLTNDAATIQALYPGLVVSSTSNFFQNVYTTNLTAYFTNYPWDPLGTPAHLVFLTNVTSTVATRFVHSFGNVFLITPSGSRWTQQPLSTVPPANGKSWVTVETTIIGFTNTPWTPVTGTNAIFTNVTDVTYQTNGVSGDFAILPTNFCEFVILSSQLTNVTTITNTITSALNLFPNTNVSGTILSFTQNVISYFTNHYFIIEGITCQASNVALYQGVEKVSFVRRDFDSLLGRFWAPITNDYVLNSITNSGVLRQRTQRVVTAPDILISAADLAVGPATFPPAVFAETRNINFNQNFRNGQPPQLLGGPGTIETGTGLPPIVFTYNNVGPIFLNTGLIDTNAFLTELDQISEFIWASFDGTTNEPVIYPNDVSIQGLEAQMLLQITPGYLPNGTVGVGYAASLQVQSSNPSWQGPFFWTLAPGSPSLPPGLSIGTSGFSSGFISGTPTQDGFFDFTIRVGDSLGHTIDRSAAIRIVPHP
jgi:hypothetical protein